MDHNPMPRLSLAALLLLVVACNGSTAPTPVYTPTGVIAPLETFGPATATPGSACASGRYRDFDFWLGEWDITVNGNAAGVSSIRQLVSGCAMLEFYQGGAGQSLNVYDASTNQWLQTYVFSTPGALLMRGALIGGEMILEDLLPNGTVSRWTWTQLNPTQVRQKAQATTTAGVTTTNFDGVYTKRSSAGTGPGATGAGCPANALAFTVGNWNVFEGDPAGTDTHRGTATITAENRNCVIIERTTGASGFSGISFTLLNTRDNKLLRDYMDSDGRYFRTTGTLTSGKVVLLGTRKSVTGGDAVVRLTYEPVSATEFKLTYEFAQDAVSAFGSARTYRYMMKF